MKSRYGFPCLFFSSEPVLAMLYASHKASFSGNKFGFLYKVKIQNCFDTIDFHGKTSYSIEFKQLIIKLKKQGFLAVKITNVLDYPSNELRVHNNSDILVVFDFSLIESIELLKNKIPAE